MHVCYLLPEMNASVLDAREERMYADKVSSNFISRILWNAIGLPERTMQLTELKTTQKS